MSRGLVDPDGLAKKFYHIHDLDGVVCVILREELNEAIALVHHGHPVLGHVYVDHRPGLHE